MSLAFDALVSVCNIVATGRQTPPPNVTVVDDKTPPKPCAPVAQKTIVYSVTSNRLITMPVTMPSSPSARSSKTRGTALNGATIIRKKYTCNHGPMRNGKCKNCSNPQWRLKCMKTYTVSYTRSPCFDETTVYASEDLLNELNAYKADAS